MNSFHSYSLILQRISPVINYHLLSHSPEIFRGSLWKVIDRFTFDTNISYSSWDIFDEFLQDLIPLRWLPIIRRSSWYPELIYSRASTDIFLLLVLWIGEMFLVVTLFLKEYFSRWSYVNFGKPDRSMSVC